ncbi:restriction endonuclease [Geitlerinema sp. CS-897]|nr:restriction endonuclease [Geitlerinema sp. CS-897]
MTSDLTKSAFLTEAQKFSEIQSSCNESSLYGVTDGKKVGTYLEQKFNDYLEQSYTYVKGNAASGIDFPELEVDVKTTSIRQPQSSCPFKSARQKIFGLGYDLLIFVYEKSDNHPEKTSHLNIHHTIFVERQHTADYQMTRGILDILNREGNSDDLVAFMLDRNLPVDDIEAYSIAGEILEHPPTQGYLTISNALQWRLQYGRVIQKAGLVRGVMRL